MLQSYRFEALRQFAQRQKSNTQFPQQVISSYFGEMVFNDQAIQAYLPARIYRQFKATISQGLPLERDLADHIADAMRNWAIDQGVTHYAHWFQPLTGRTAEKHDSFFTLDSQGRAIERFSADALVQQEPDGSSFPGGGLRSTFEARGYTAWDPSSPAFIMAVEGAKTLCIPTIFVTYAGQSLDYKLPLLKSQRFLEQAALDLYRLFDQQVQRVYTTLGWEQEYFLVDEALFNARPDLFLTGRTLIGRYAAKGQQMEDHYFGAIPDRVYAFMRDLEIEAHRLGIPVRTRHNEVAPSQYELAPIFEEVNVAIDHNQLLMDLMDRVAKRHSLRVLLHEKPYANVNGSGKHNNWSLATDTGKNLLAPGSNPKQNLPFLTFLTATIEAVWEHGDLLRASVATAGNDHRLGANEAPPAIVSVFVGDHLNQILNELERGQASEQDNTETTLNLTSQIPELQQDNTDRNRTSPFAFTGNKFEVRMVGSSQNCAGPMTVLNMMVGSKLREFYQELSQALAQGQSLETSLQSLLPQSLKKSKNIRFEGDNYSEAWREEAARRGLNNFPTTPQALAAYVSQKAQALFQSSGVLSPQELQAHYEVRLDTYALQIQMESRVLAEICLNQILPAALRYQGELAQNVLALQDLELSSVHYEAQLDLVKQLSAAVNYLKRAIDQMKIARDQADQAPHIERAQQYNDKVKPLMSEIRQYTDVLEQLIDDQAWPLPKYRELFFFK